MNSNSVDNGFRVGINATFNIGLKSEVSVCIRCVLKELSLSLVVKRRQEVFHEACCISHN